MEDELPVYLLSIRSIYQSVIRVKSWLRSLPMRSPYIFMSQIPIIWKRVFVIYSFRLRYASGGFHPWPCF